MNRLISIGLAIAVAPAILLAIGLWIDSPDTVHVSEVALFSVALPLGGLLVIFGLCKAAINTISPSQLPLTHKTITHNQVRLEIIALLNFLRWVLNKCHVVYGMFHKLAKNCVFWLEVEQENQETKKVLLNFLRCMLNGCHVAYRLAKNRAFWREILDVVVRLLTWLPSQIVPLLLTGVLGLFIAGTLDLPNNALVAMLLVLDNLDNMFKTGSIANLGHVQACKEWTFFGGAHQCANYNLRKLTIILWAFFYALWIWRSRAKFN